MNCYFYSLEALFYTSSNYIISQAINAKLNHIISRVEMNTSCNVQVLYN